MVTTLTTCGVNESGALLKESMSIRPEAIGKIIMFAGSTAPEGTLYCNGAAISRTTYSELFAAIGTTYGAGDGSTTFNLPDLRGKWMVGLGSVFPQLGPIDASLPEIYGSIGSVQMINGAGVPTHAVNYSPYGALSIREEAATQTGTVQLASVAQTINFAVVLRASDYNDVYGRNESAGVVPESVALLPCIIYE